MTDLESRIEGRKRELISEIVEHKKNCSRAGAAEAIDRAKTRLAQLADILKGVAWTDVPPSARLKLDEWMGR